MRDAKKQYDVICNVNSIVQPKYMRNDKKFQDGKLFP